VVKILDNTDTKTEQKITNATWIDVNSRVSQALIFEFGNGVKKYWSLAKPRLNNQSEHTGLGRAEHRVKSPLILNQ